MKEDMLTIVNNSGHVVNIFNNYFSKDIPIDASITLTRQDLQNDHHCKLKYFSQKEKTENDLEEVRDIGNRWTLAFSSKTYIPMITDIDIENCTEIKLLENTVTFHFLTMIVKTVSLKQITVEDSKINQTFSFVQQSSKKKFLIYLLIELLITLPILLVFICASIYSFIELTALYESIFMSVLSLLFTYSVVRKLYYFIYYKKIK